MGRSPRAVPERLSSKLHAMRLYLDLTQEAMTKRLSDDKSPIYQGTISEYESGAREPSLLVLLRYVRTVNMIGEILVTIEMLADDEMDLPGDLRAYTTIIEESQKTKKRRRGTS